MCWNVFSASTCRQVHLAQRKKHLLVVSAGPRCLFGVVDGLVGLAQLEVDAGEIGMRAAVGGVELEQAQELLARVGPLSFSRGDDSEAEVGVAQKHPAPFASEFDGARVGGPRLREITELERRLAFQNPEARIIALFFDPAIAFGERLPVFPHLEKRIGANAMFGRPLDASRKRRCSAECACHQKRQPQKSEGKHPPGV
jgi:hypothetical protein